MNYRLLYELSTLKLVRVPCTVGGLSLLSATEGNLSLSAALSRSAVHAVAPVEIILAVSSSNSILMSVDVRYEVSLPLAFSAGHSLSSLGEVSPVLPQQKLDNINLFNK